MATNKKINECGWFYHAPAKPKAPQEPVLLPPTSQIPGLNTEMDGQFQDDPPRPLFRDSDSKYIRLAKQGGRQNLLYFKENPNMSERAPKGYPRPEWFYLEDNAIEDAEAKKREHPEFEQPYQFMVPEYMVHEEWRPETDSYQRPARLPYAYDRTSAYERDGHHANDKTVKLPEVKKTGFGVRNAKPLRTKPKPVERTKPSTVAKQSQLEQERPHLKYLPLPDSDNKKDKASMSKILGYEYERKWHDDIDKWQYKQDRLRDQHKAMLTADDKDPRVSEYKTTFGKQGQQRPYVQEKGRKVWETTSNKSISARKTEKEEKELFKLSKFKNVGSRIDAKRSPKESPVSMATNQAPVPITAH